MNRSTFRTIARNIRQDGCRTDGVYKSYGFHAVYDGETLGFVRNCESHLRGTLIGLICSNQYQHKPSERRALVDLLKGTFCDVVLP
jgi:hypothetical protein